MKKNLEKNLQKSGRKKNQVFLDSPEASPRAVKISDYLNKYTQHVKEPTHDYGSVLDHIYTKDIDVDLVGYHYTYYSDHHAVCFKVKIP